MDTPYMEATIFESYPDRQYHDYFSQNYQELDTDKNAYER